MTDDAKPSRLHIPALDGLRGVALVLVLVHNLSILEVRNGIAAKLWGTLVNAGWIGVQLFFVLSGFLITGILLDDRGQPRFFRNFYIRRTIRIFPLYYLVLLARFVVLPLFMPRTAVPLRISLWFWIYLSNWSRLLNPAVGELGHFWSLAIEEQIYLLWPIAVARLRTGSLAWLCIALVTLAPLVRIALWAGGHGPQFSYVSTVTRSDALALGALVALAIRSAVWRTWLQRWHRRIAGAAGFALVGLSIHTHGLGYWPPETITVGYSILGVLFAAGIAAIVLDETRSRPRWATTSVLRSLGKYSYAAYVFHFPVKLAVLHFWGRPITALLASRPLTVELLFVATTAAVSLALAFLSYVVIEGPLLRLKDRWAPRDSTSSKRPTPRTARPSPTTATPSASVESGSPGA